MGFVKVVILVVGFSGGLPYTDSLVQPFFITLRYEKSLGKMY